MSPTSYLTAPPRDNVFRLYPGETSVSMPTGVIPANPEIRGRLCKFLSGQRGGSQNLDASRGGGRLLLIEVDDHVRFVSAYFACAGFTLFLFDLAGRGLNFHHLAGDGHFRFISALFALTLFNSLSLLSHWNKPPRIWKLKI